MYHGSFPDPGRPEPAPLPARPSRRSLLRCAGLFLLGSAAGGLTARWTAPSPGASTGSNAPPATRGSLEWARSLERASDAELMAAAGDLEFVRASHPDEGDLLIPLFERILDIAEFEQGPTVDTATSISVRSIARLGRPEDALDYSARLEGRADLPHTADQRRRILEKLRRVQRQRSRESNR